MKTLHINLPLGSYPLYLGNNIRLQKTLFEKHIQSSQVMIVSNPIVADLYLADIQSCLSDYHVNHILIPDGEHYKNSDSLNKIFDTLLEKRHRRNTTLIALGGGVIGDMAGFAAACYQRGAHFIQVPTSLLAQVDASIGGKTAINHSLGKNMIGAFYQPQAVIIDIATLHTLPDREFNSGLAEIIKHALIADADFFIWLETHIDAIMQKDTETLIDMTERSCRIKAHIVEQDERETVGIRQLLNFGHTLGHALETASHYQYYLHGEAVAIGMVFAAKVSEYMGHITSSDVTRIKAILSKAHLPTRCEHSINSDVLLSHMKRDKKNRDEQITFIILGALGQATASDQIDQNVFQHALMAIC